MYVFNFANFLNVKSMSINFVKELSLQAIRKVITITATVEELYKGSKDS